MAPTIQPDDLVDLTVYFRHGTGSGSYLEPVTREVTVTEDLPRTAVELLLEGPQDGDASGLAAALPTTTELHDLDIEGDLATVDLSAAVIRDARTVGATPEHEVLALAAIAGTLTEFPAVERVRLLVEGQDSGWHAGVEVERFWGSWGLPRFLTRDESVIGPPRDGEGVPDLDLFLDEPQRAGSADAAPVEITGIRTRERTTYLRVTMELAGGADTDAPVSVPPTRARPDGRGGIRVQIGSVSSLDGDTRPGDSLDLSSFGFTELTVGDDELPGPATVTIGGVEDRAFRLHTLTSPTRIVLDIKK